MRWVETRDWEQAFHAVIPRRKFQTKGIDHAEADGEDEVDEQEEDNVDSK